MVFTPTDIKMDGTWGWWLVVYGMILPTLTMLIDEKPYQ